MSLEEAKTDCPTSVYSKAVKNCTQGLIEKVKTPAADARTDIALGLDVVNSRQEHLAKRVSLQNEKFYESEETFNVGEAVQKTRYYYQKLASLHKEMMELSDRSASMKSRALKLLDAKQEEALRRESKRIADLEKEEMLVAKPAQKKN